MPLPKKIKKNIPLTESKTLLPRRRELVDKINKDGTYLPKSLLHADLDGGFLEFVKNTPTLKPYRTEWIIYHEDLKLAGSIDMIYENEDGTKLIKKAVWDTTQEIPINN